ncbi:N-6 DNA methylase [Maribellus maritimus]|uniref:N-6 DNA methylase n=1 Tax=Maribellus maritimus TaxID=2870838 RepID=UPI001EEBD884|nr:N-6 DNA methylase [Maribellus maritimus]MCG6190886.1 N-6 DNA methylase [Maribellus maritimus]
MLDTQTKKRIDDCRDILVGKLPDPKAQIEQITIGLIYKFMDDMDKEAVELGGKAKFFSNYFTKDPENPDKEIQVEFEKYSWDKLFDTKVTASEMLKLYSEAIEGMEKNPNIPQLFRDIFNNAYLPYRDPETLKLFLKTINEFEYTHSEKLGDAFEYLLSVMGSQGDAGQFRTPRHIIDFLVTIVDPQKTDTILDPACGTAGFLISAFKYIRGNSDHRTDNACVVPTALTPDEQKKLINNIRGYDISPDMVRLSLVNLYLHGFSDPHINEYDTLSSEERWDEYFDVVLANPPFMSPKGGIRPHKKFTIKSNRSEVLFVDYIAEHLNPKGRAGVIVPEGVIFQSGTAYKDLRKMLVENYLYAVVSLPAGVFNPYSGVKTSILLMDKEITKSNNEILFVKIDNDGFNLGAQRTAIKGSQLDEAIQAIKQFKSGDFADSSLAHAVLKTDIGSNGEYNLSGDRYKTISHSNSDFEFVKLSEITDVRDGTHDSPKYVETGYPLITSKNVKDGYIDYSNVNYISKDDYDKINQRSYVDDGDIIMPMIGTIGNPIVVKKEKEFAIKNVALIKFYENSKINNHYLRAILGSDNFSEHYNNSSSGSTQKFISLSFIRNLEIPLPPLSVQEEIVAEIEGYQKIIDGAKMVVENYKPKIDIPARVFQAGGDPDWKMVELGKIISTQTGGTPSKANDSFWIGDIPWVSPKDMKLDFISDSEDHISELAVKNSSTKIVPANTILIVVRSGILKHSLPIALTSKPVSFNQDIIAIQTESERLFQKYLFYYLKSTSSIHIQNGIKPGVTVQSFHNGYFKKLSFPLPPLNIQKQIVLQIEKEEELVNANKQLIEIFEQKIKDRIAKVWGTSSSLGTGGEKAEKEQALDGSAEPSRSMAAEPKTKYKTN